MDGRVDGSMGGWIDGWMDRSMDGWIDGWMGGWMACGTANAGLALDSSETPTGHPWLANTSPSAMVGMFRQTQSQASQEMGQGEALPCGFHLGGYGIPFLWDDGQIVVLSGA